MQVACAHCGAATEKATGEVTRAAKSGLKLYCDRRCSGLGRRKGKTKEQRVAEKQAYDTAYRARNAAAIKNKKAAYFRKTYDPVKAARDRKQRMPKHIEYCRRPEYRQWKARYDRRYRAKLFYGELWESFVLVLDIRDAVLQKKTDYEIRLSKGTLNKALRRRRDYDRTFCEEPEIGALGNLERGERW